MSVYFYCSKFIGMNCEKMKAAPFSSCVILLHSNRYRLNTERDVSDGKITKQAGVTSCQHFRYSVTNMTLIGYKKT